MRVLKIHLSPHLYIYIYIYINLCSVVALYGHILLNVCICVVACGPLVLWNYIDYIFHVYLYIYIYIYIYGKCNLYNSTIQEVHMPQHKYKHSAVYAHIMPQQSTNIPKYTLT